MTPTGKPGEYRMPNGETFTIREYYCDAQYPDGPPRAQDHRECEILAAGCHVRLARALGIRVRGDVDVDGDAVDPPDRNGASRIVLTDGSRLRCGVPNCCGYIVHRPAVPASTS